MIGLWLLHSASEGPRYRDLGVAARSLSEKTATGLSNANYNSDTDNGSSDMERHSRGAGSWPTPKMKSADHEEEHMPGQDDYARSQSLGPRFRPEDNEFYKRLDGETDSKFRQRIVDAALTEKRHPSKIVLSGKVIDSGGNPIAGAEITLKKYIKQKSIGMGAFGSVAIERVTFSREDGRFSLINVTPGRKLVYASKKGYRKAPPKEVLLEECKKAEKAVNAEVVIVLRAKANVLTISGTCRDVKGFPIEGAKVCVRMTEYEKERDACFGRTHSAVSDRMGRFVVGNLQRGTAHLRGMTAKYCDVVIDRIPTGTENVELVFKEGVGTVSGVIRIPPGHQPEKFIVILAAASQTARDMETAVSVKGESTKFRLEGVQPGEYVAFCHAKRLARGEVRNIKVAPGVETEGVVMELTAGGVLSGTVRWKDAEANVSAALVVLKPAMEDRGQVRQMSTDRNGVFVLENVVPGQYYISASKGTVSSPDGHTQVVIEDGEKKNIEIELHRGKTIRGKITCHDKSGLSSILVACYPKEAQPIMTKPVRDGYFAFHHLGPGNYKVALMDIQTKGLLRTKKVILGSDENQRADFALEGATFKGSVTIGRQICQNMPFSLKSQKLSCMIVTDDVGKFTARFVPPGKYTVSFLPPGAGPSDSKTEVEIEIPKDQTEFTYDFNL
jgi:hypothetical protein